MIGPLFSQSAWNNVTFTGGETRDPGRTLPMAMILGMLVGGLLYLLANVAYVVTLPLDAIQHAPQDRVGTAAMQAVLGPTGETVMAGAILISTFGCVNGLVLAGRGSITRWPRTACSSAASRPRTAPRAGGRPGGAGVWAALLVLPVTVDADAATGGFKSGNLYGELLEYVIPVDVTFYILMVGAVIAAADRRPGCDGPTGRSATPAHPVSTSASRSCWWPTSSTSKPWTSGKGYLIVLAGIPVYLLSMVARWPRARRWRTRLPERRLRPS